MCQTKPRQTRKGKKRREIKEEKRERDRENRSTSFPPDATTFHPSAQSQLIVKLRIFVEACCCRSNSAFRREDAAVDAVHLL